MRNLRFWAFALLIGLSLAGCQETPERVKDNMKSYGENPQLAEPEVTYCSVDELREAKLTDTDNGNLILTEDVDFSAIEDIGILHIKMEDGFLDDGNIEKYASLFQIDKEGFVEGEASGFGKCITYGEGEEDDYMNICENGGMAYIAKHNSSPGTGEAKAEYSLAKDDISGVFVDFPDGSVSLPRFCQDIERWMDREMPIEGVSHKVSDVAVRGQDGGKDTLSMCVEYEYKGIRFNNHTTPLYGDTYYENGDVDLLTTYFMTLMDFGSQGVPSFFTRNESFSIESSDPITQVVDLGSAIKVVKDTMSGFGISKIQEILPLYIPYTPEHSKMPGKKIEARPVYAFLTGKDEEETPDRLVSGLGRYRHFFLVDMVTGELWTDLEMERKG